MAIRAAPCRPDALPAVRSAAPAASQTLAGFVAALQLQDIKEMLRPMDARIARLLKLVAMVMAAGVIGWAAHDWFSDRSAPGDLAYMAGNRAFEDVDYAAAAAAYRTALEQAPDHIHALRGLAQSLHMAGLHERALLTYDEAIAHEPEFGGVGAAKLGLVRDRLV